MREPQAAGPLAGITVLDLSRVLAGPWCSQVLGDLGADVIKVEQPGQGDDTRKWGPPFLDDGSRDAAYYLCANRNKRSVAIDMAKPEGADLIRRFAARADVVIENFRVGGLARYGLDFDSLRAIKPDLVYCSITGFGQTGPLRDTGGYDFLIQGMSGLMSVTGLPDGEPGGGPMKVGLPVCDLQTGLYAAISILAALHHRHATGEGQHIDLALLDTQVALLANQASNWLNGGVTPRRMGNLHPTVVPYQDFACADGDVLVAIGNDRQFRQFMDLLGLGALADDPRFAISSGRCLNRDALMDVMRPVIARWQAADLIAAMQAAGLPGGKVNEIPEVLAHPQIEARGLVHEMARSDGTPVKVLGFPAQLSATPATYRHAPPRSGEDTVAVLGERLGLDRNEIDRLLAAGVIAERL
ncbi:CaiB/BaiF CoA transferase family protein [Novosphingobium taihuense]|uniref:Crotonobetainyl-CoA:carnitine CoA-transferase CaiB-like acyl-CoA transferase n=1 Tax=Novosphingobium taihuense TaxID=260085 RepID=A0A7W7ABL6_9SPHN|nr:CaiB/BaiF CoA-transferase family protein [Novosphingobium taihuense]MBB4613946.1 crotonobetainyl-CoA:carnitine CoA-transferase CaiB-like acyl-CoA transferase [Novosphingobium taihuense]TWH86797.1 crotonobetainyl-CoA:carnitine CoA-transferase CaiB-like acyl-CoA transferase [Novosphingobium taihuense]